MLKEWLHALLLQPATQQPFSPHSFFTPSPLFLNIPSSYRSPLSLTHSLSHWLAALLPSPPPLLSDLTLILMVLYL